MKRKRSQGEKKTSASDPTPEVLAETWNVVEEELKAAGFQVSMRINLKGKQRTHCLSFCLNVLCFRD